MNPIVERLAYLLRVPVAKVNNCIGPEVQEAARQLQPGQVLMLENVRFHPGEVVNDAHFAARLSSIADLFVYDAFASAHRAHASTEGVARYLPAVSGLLLESELEGLRRIHGLIRAPVVVLLGGTRLIDKAHFIDFYIERINEPGAHEANRLLVAGMIGNTFLHVRGLEVGQSKIDREAIALARELLSELRQRILMPVDVMITRASTPNRPPKAVAIDRVPVDGCIVDIGPQTIDRFTRAIQSAATVIWNGPLGQTNAPEYPEGSYTIARKIAALKNVTTIAGGGDTLAMLDRAGVSGEFDYLSTGGAAFLDALRGRPMPAINALQEADTAATAPAPTAPLSQGTNET
jgi:phosphoglycerate kinase